MKIFRLYYNINYFYQTYQCLQELKGIHLDTITCLVEAGFGTVWSADRRGILSIWEDKEEDEEYNPGPRTHRRLRSKSCK